VSEGSSELLRLRVSSGKGTQGGSPGSRVASGGLGGGLGQRRVPGSPPAVRTVTGCSARQGVAPGVGRGPLGFLRTGRRAGREPALSRWGGTRGREVKPGREGHAGTVSSQTLGRRDQGKHRIHWHGLAGNRPTERPLPHSDPSWGPSLGPPRARPPRGGPQMSEVEGGSSAYAGWWQTWKLLGPGAVGRASSTLSGPGFLTRHGSACGWALQLLPPGRQDGLELGARPCS